MINHGIIEVATAAPQNIEIGNPAFNAEEIKKIISSVEIRNTYGSRQTRILVFPELSITGYTCGDLFGQQILLDEVELAIESLTKILAITDKMPLVFVGAPIRKDNKLFNCAVAIKDGEVVGIIPKTYIPNYGVFYENRNFSSAENRLSDEITFLGKTVPFTPNLLIEDTTSGAIVGVDVCEDLWVPIPPSSHHALAGANIIVNLSASNEVVGKAEYRRNLVKMHSAQIVSGYVYVSASRDESTTDNVFSGHSIISENGHIVSESTLFDYNEITYGEIDIEKCMNERMKMTTFYGSDNRQYKRVSVNTFNDNSKDFKTNLKVALYPFISSNMDERTFEILHLQAAGLAQRMKKIGVKTALIGISGGLDSTLALIATIEAFKLNKLDISGIIGVTMPCFGTSNRTLNNSKLLMDAMGITSMEVNIEKAVIQHLNDINHPKDVFDITYENAQARERTQVLMDLANQHQGIVIGTGDLSELALGWCTYNGDQMSSYSVNASVPKTLVKVMIHSYAKVQEESIKKTLLDIIDTPISPELLPANRTGDTKDGPMAQLTESIIGPYVTHDFILYHMLRFGFRPSKIYALYLRALEIEGTEVNYGKEVEILETFKTFYKRFFSQQFKRSAMPDGVKVGSVSLSPRGDWRMPSDAVGTLWLKDLESVTIIN